MPPKSALDVLDVGCGTGPVRAAAGAVCADGWSAWISPAGMLKHAAEKQVYDELVQAELTEYLQQHPGRVRRRSSPRIRWCISARSRSWPRQRRRALRPGGVLVFTVEEAVEPAMAQSYAHPAARPLHARRRRTCGGCSSSADWTRTSGARNCAWSPDCRSPAWSCAPRSRRAGHDGRQRGVESTMARVMEITTPLGDDVLLFHAHARARGAEPRRRVPARAAEPQARHRSRSDPRQERHREAGAAGRQDPVLQRLRDAILAGRHARPVPALLRDRAPVALVPDAARPTAASSRR